jgi:hypothetical protein
MTNARKPQPESPVRRRKRRSRPIPGWLKEQQDLDEMAKRRTLMVLEVLSGQKPVTDAVEEAQISRPLYYQLETKAVRAMLAALQPNADPTGQPVGTIERLKMLEQKCARLEQANRRLERLLYVTKQVVRPGPVGVRSSTATGKKSSPASTVKTAAPSTPPSIPTPSGAGARSGGSGN